MNKIEQDIDYINLVGSVLYNDKFNEIKNIEHHGITRYDHSLKVSYYSYKLAKMLKLNYKVAARAGLLHDYFISEPNITFKEKFISTFSHPKIALKTADECFGVNEIEADIIKSHMFPFYINVPKYAESWIVNIVDKVIGAAEFCNKFSYKFNYVANLALLFIINIGK